jgi:predicted AlkP superfamily pyrophosphatase or phosphodiesterase
MHGYWPDQPEMRSSFFLVGPTLAKGHLVGEIDMRQIAPTVAKIMGVSLASAELPPLPLH